MKAATFGQATPSTSKTFFWLIGFVILSLIVREIPVIDMILRPLDTFGVAVHEMGHGLACIATGGHVEGMTIVADGEGHGGLTFCKGGNPFIYTQAGYVGEALFGCGLILLSRYPRLSRAILVLIGVTIGLGSLFLMSGTIVNQGEWFAGIASMVWGLVIAGAFVLSGAKLSDKLAHPLLLFIAVQSALASVSGVWVLLLQSLGMYGNAWSDATNMQQLTRIPAFLWGMLWTAISVGSLTGTMWWSYKLDNERSSGV